MVDVGHQVMSLGGGLVMWGRKQRAWRGSAGDPRREIRRSRWSRSGRSDEQRSERIVDA